MTRAAILAALLLAACTAPRAASDDSPRPGQLGAPQRSQTGGVRGYTLGVVSEPPKPAATSGAPPASTYRGTATWYCGHGSRCPKGYGPDDLVAAIDRKDSPFRKGDRVEVRYSCGKGCLRAVRVTIVDVCACGGVRLIDLTTGAFQRLAPLGLGVIPVTIAPAAAAPTLPPTDEENR